MTDLSDRLSAVVDQGNLTYSDLHRWFNRPYPTVRSWAVGYCQPAKKDELKAVFQRLEVLERLVQSPPFPLSSEIGIHAHSKLFRNISNAYHARVSRGDSTG